MTPASLQRLAQEQARQEFIAALEQEAKRQAENFARDLLVEQVTTATFTGKAEKDKQFDRSLGSRYSRMLYRVGRYLQTVARNSIRWRAKGRSRKVRAQYGGDGIPSAPYTPPRIPLYRKSDSPLRALMAFDVQGDWLIAGPRLFRPSQNIKVRPTGGQTIAAVLEHGGRQTMRTKLGAKTITYAPRPFMSLALVKAVNANTFRSLLSQLDPL